MILHFSLSNTMLVYGIGYWNGKIWVANKNFIVIEFGKNIMIMVLLVILLGVLKKLLSKIKVFIPTNSISERELPNCFIRRNLPLLGNQSNNQPQHLSTNMAISR